MVSDGKFTSTYRSVPDTYVFGFYAMSNFKRNEPMLIFIKNEFWKNGS